MKINNHLPLLLHCLEKWQKMPSKREFYQTYAAPLSTTSVEDFFENFYSVIQDLNWDQYRTHTLKLNPEKEQKRLEHWIHAIEKLFDFKLKGEVILLGTFHTMDGFAQFDKGQHRVFLGVDENFHHPHYCDILIAHELTHVARETRPEVWEGYGLDPLMSRSVYLNAQTVVEHLMGEGLSCAVSEILVPGLHPSAYVYQTESSYEKILSKKAVLDHHVKLELKHPDGDYGNLYGIDPTYAHYTWAFHWVKKLLAECNHDPKKLVGRCSKDFLTHALHYDLSKL